MAGEFAGKVAWVVGASGGLGTAISRAFVESGATVVVSGRDAAKLDEIGAESADPDRVHAVPLDVTRSDDVRRVAEAIIERHGRVDVLVNTTSVSIFGDFLTLGDEEWRSVYEAKLFAYVRTMRSVIPHMLSAGGGAIVNVSGNGGRLPAFPSHIAGCSGNAAVNLATKAVGDLYFSRGVRVNCVAPGPIRSKRLDQIASAEAALGERGAPARAAPSQKLPLGEAEDIANATLFLASDRARHINGIVLTVDGGMTPTVV